MASTHAKYQFVVDRLSFSRPQFLHLSNGNINRLYLIGVVVGFKQEKASKMLTPSEGLSY